MLRIAEIILLLAPLAAFIGWRVFMPGRKLSYGVIAAAAAALALMALVLVWLRTQDAAPPDAIYIPQHMENGQIVPGRAVSK